MDENITVKDQIIQQFIKDLITGKADDVADDEGQDELDPSEVEQLIDLIRGRYCDGKNLAEINRVDLFNGNVSNYVAEKTREILNARARVFEVEVTVKYTATIKVKARDADEAEEYVRNMEERDIGNEVDYNWPDEWEVESVSDEGSVEEYGCNDYYDATE